MGKAELSGVSLEYRLEGEGPETVVLLNGIAMTISHWDPVAARLREAGYKVLRHDLRGQLLSGRGGTPYSFEGHAADLAALMDLLGLESAHVFGTSYGAEVALTFARDFPERCLSVASLDGVTECDALLRATVEAWKFSALSDPRAFYKSILPWNYSAAYIASHREALAQREEAVASLPADYFEAFAGLCDAFLAIDLTKDLPRLKMPCLAAVAAQDILKGPRYSRIIAGGAADGRYLEILGAGHAVAIERPEAVAAAFLDFLRTVGGGTVMPAD